MEKRKEREEAEITEKYWLENHGHQFFHEDGDRTAQWQPSTDWIIFQSGGNGVDGKRRGSGRRFMNNSNWHPLKSPIPAEPQPSNSHRELKQGQKCHSWEWEYLGKPWGRLAAPTPELIPVLPGWSFSNPSVVILSLWTSNELDFSWINPQLITSAEHCTRTNFYLFPCPCDWFTGNGNLCLQAEQRQQPGLLLPIKARKTQKYCSPFPIFHFL